MTKSVDKKGIKRYYVYLTDPKRGVKDKKLFESKNYDSGSKKFFNACEYYRKKIIL
jgi:hypothetical protein